MFGFFEDKASVAIVPAADAVAKVATSVSSFDPIAIAVGGAGLVGAAASACYTYMSNKAIKAEIANVKKQTADLGSIVEEHGEKIRELEGAIEMIETSIVGITDMTQKLDGKVDNLGEDTKSIPAIMALLTEMKKNQEQNK